MRFFSYESKFSQLVLKLCYACFLNLLWFLCSIPIVTIGASTAALYYTSFKIIREEDNHAGAMFFRAFRDNFKQATVLWLIMLAFGIFLSGDIYILYHLRRTTEGPMAVIWTLMLAFVIVAAVFYIIILEYVFPLVASVKNTSIAMLKNSFLIGTHYLFATILVFAVHFAMFFVIVAWFTPLIVLGEGLCAMVSAWLLNRIMIASSGTPEDKAEE
ncbi:MAG: YesL family protein, partial [Lachnospiraceae bacterium]|nr:YesL family protein [Lachnospiraceae bacterium]